MTSSLKSDNLLESWELSKQAQVFALRAYIAIRELSVRDSTLYLSSSEDFGDMVVNL